MPCSDGRDAPIDHDAVIRFCCETLRAYEANGVPIPVYIQQWWEDHKEWDAWERRHFTAPTPAFKSRGRY